jgi:tetratricopeptide (TPR) repeat protein
VYRPIGRVEESAPEEAVLVGREREQQFLHARIDAGAQGAGGLVGLIGEAGIGKSFLLHDAVRHAQSHNIRVLVGDGDALERATSYYIWRQLLAQLLVDGPGASAQELRTALLQRLANDETLLAWAPLLNAILPLGLDDNDVTRSMESEARIESIQTIIVSLLERASADRPTLIVIDDVHWIDSSSLALFTGVALRVPHLMILFGTRPLDDLAPAAMRRLVHWPGIELIQLEPLSDRGVEALINQRLGSNVVPADVLQFILQRAEGHPFYTEELALALREAGLITVEQGECRVVADLRGANFPDSVQAVVNSRIDRLHPVEQLALKTASVIGRAFASEVLSAVYPIPNDLPQLPRALDAIERADLARRETPDPHLSYLFRHAITQDVAYNSLLFAHRRQLHEGIASWYEQRYDGALSALYPVLAHHWDRAEVAAKAVEYLEKAGVEAFNAFSTQECAQFFTRVLEIAEGHPELADVHRRIEWQRYLGDAYQHMTDYHRSQQHFREALRLAGRRMPQSRIGIIGALLKECARQALHRLAPSRFIGSARGERARDLENAAVTYRGLTEIFFFQGDPLAMVYTSVASLNCGERTRHAQTMATGAGGTASVLALVGARRLQRFYIDLAVRYARAGGSITDIAYTDGIQTTIVEIASCRWPEAEQACLRGLAGFARVGYRVRWENLYAGYGFMLQLIGRFDDAMTAFDKVYASARGNRLQNMIFARSGQLGTALPRGEIPEAWVAELEELVGRSAPMTEATTSYGLIAQARLRRGDIDGAWTSLETGLALLTDHAPASYYGLTGFAFVAMSYLEMWERNLAPVDARAIGERARAACGMLSRYGTLFRMGRPRALLCAGWYDALRGRDARAIRRFYKGLASAQKLRMPYDEALLHYELARHLPDTDRERAEHLRHAIAGFSDLGATYDLERAMAL